tara:strand:- start:112 stop:438 length:327 start_codon:yes stop_codon:yes gene_type:complete
MAFILKKKRKNDKYLYQLSCSKEEYIRLRHEHKKVHFFHDALELKQGSIYVTGQSNTSKYFALPSQWIMHRKQRKRLTDSQPNNIKIQRINFPDRIVFIYTITKIKKL